jgi:hypothetical protein
VASTPSLKNLGNSRSNRAPNEPNAAGVGTKRGTRNDAATCAHCGKPAQLETGEAVYPERPDLAQKSFYFCRPCRAWVGCHPHTTKPLGTAANYALRSARRRAHAAFDPLWHVMSGFSRQGSGAARKAAYKWLAETLGIERDQCHIGMFSLDQCHRVITACDEWRRTRGDFR